MNKDNNNPIELPDVRDLRFFDDDDTEHKQCLTEAPYVSYKFIMETLDDTSEAFEKSVDDPKEAYAIDNALNRVGAVISRAVVAHLTKVVNEDNEQKPLNK